MPDSAPSTDIKDMRNLGPATARMLAEVDICYQAELRRVGAVSAYRRLRFRFGGAATIVALYAIEAALRGCDWRALDAATRDRLRQEAKAV